MLYQYRRTRARVCLLLLWGCSGVVFAQEASKTEEEKELANPAFVPEYSSIFESYIPFDEVPEISWRDANDAVGQFGGWRAYLKLVQEEAKRKAEREKQQIGGNDQ